MNAALLFLLLAPAASKHLRDGDGCECLNWKDVYMSYRVRCGQGYELAAMEEMSGGKSHSFMTPQALPTTAQALDPNYKLGELVNGYDMMCKQLYMKFNFKGCVNIGDGPQQWCYSDNKCLSSEIKRVPQADSHKAAISVGIKTCSDGGDPLMSNMAPEELNTLAFRSGLDPIQLASISYAQSEEMWPDLEPGANLTEDAVKQIHSGDMHWKVTQALDFKAKAHNALLKTVATSKLASVKASGKTTIFELGDDVPGSVIVSDEKVYAYKETAVKTGMLFKPKKSMMGYECVKGCDTSS